MHHAAKYTAFASFSGSTSIIMHTKPSVRALRTVMVTGACLYSHSSIIARHASPFTPSVMRCGFVQSFTAAIVLITSICEVKHDTAKDARALWEKPLYKV